MSPKYLTDSLAQLLHVIVSSLVLRIQRVHEKKYLHYGLRGNPFVIYLKINSVCALACYILFC